MLLENSQSYVPEYGCVTSNLKFGEFSNSFEDRARHVKVQVDLTTELSYGMCFALKDVTVISNKFDNPSSFDYKRYMQSRTIKYTGEAERLVVTNSNLLTLARNFRQKILTRNCQNFANQCTLVNTIIFGSKELDDFSQTVYGQIGIAPIFAISGMHITIIYQLIVYWLSKARVVITKANIISLIILIGYSILAGNSVALNRALIMIGSKIALKISTKQSLFLAFAISMIYNPYNILNIGYILSYVITFAIIFMPKQQFKNDNLNIITFSIICSLVALPIAYSFNYTFNLLAPLAMIVFIPLITGLLMPSATFISLVNYYPLGWFINYLIVGINGLADFFNIFTVVGGVVSSPMWIIYIFLVLAIIKGHYKLLIAIVLWFIIVAIDFDQTPTVTFIDVGQGDSAIIETGNQNFLIDIGNQPTEVLKVARHLGINHFDGVFISHAHLDHYGGLDELSRYMSFDKIYELDTNKLTQSSIAISDYTKTENFELFPIKGVGTNNQVLIVKFTLGDSTILFPGDIELESEQQLVADYCHLIDADVLKVPHHGSRSSSSQEFVDCVSPNIAVISSGKDNSYNHPHPEIVELYESRTTLYNTKEDGQVHLQLAKSD